MHKNITGRTVALALGISTFFIIFLWNFWTFGISITGINFTVFGFLIIIFYILTQQTKLSIKSISWILPTMAIIISLGIYSTPFTGIISLLLLPIIFFIFTSHESHKNLRRSIWSKLAPFILGELFITLLSSIFKAPRKLKTREKSSNQKSNINYAVITQIILGIIILFALSTLVIIPLLSSADAAFASIFKNFITQIKEFLSSLKSLPSRFIAAMLITSILVGFAHYWNRVIKTPFKNARTRESQDNSIIVGIILSGILGLYLLFIGIQIHTLFTNQLPIDFSKAENLVKSGFWQLFALTILNILFYVGVFRKSTSPVQKILMGFTLASLLLITSAAHRVFLYVTVYGLSYEKFFAFYTVIFCSIVFIWFLFLFTYPKNKPVRIVKTLSFLALWMYAFTTIIPLEQFIFNTNLKLTQQEDSRININELRMLGFDALPLVEKNFDLLIHKAQKDYLFTKKLDTLPLLEKENYNGFTKNKDLNRRVNNSWKQWIERRREKKGILRTRYFNDCKKAEADNYNNCHCANSSDENYHGARCKALKYKKWYEHTFKELFYKPIDIDFESKKLPETKIQTFLDSIHGFSVNYPIGVELDYSDSHNLEDLLNKKQVINFREGGDTLHIAINQEYTHSQRKKSHLAKTIKFVEYAREYHPHGFFLPKLKEIKSYATFYPLKNNTGMDYRLLVDAPQGVLIIYSDKAPKIDHVGVWDISLDEYISRITSSKKLQDVIKSLQIIPKSDQKNNIL